MGFPQFAINFRNGTTPNRASLSPSSFHVTSVNVLMADGSVRSLIESMDLGVYIRLITIEGSRNGQNLLSSF